MYLKEAKGTKEGSVLFIGLFLKHSNLLMYYLRFSLFPPVDLSYHLVLFPYSKIASFPTPFVPIGNIYFYMLKA